MAATRYYQLDAIRGVAALIVVMHHVWLSMSLHAFPSDNAMMQDLANIISLALKYTPLRILVAGPNCVALFFLLSGFVLASSLSSRREMTYGCYILRRLVRIYIPFVVATLIAAALCTVLRKDHVVGASSWLLNASWSEPLTIESLLGHLLAIGYEPFHQLNNPGWSLIVEMRISLVFMLVMSFTRAYTATSLLIISILYILSSSYMSVTEQAMPFSFGNSLAFLAEFLPFFLAGGILFLKKDWFSKLYLSTRPAIRVWLCVCALLLLCFPNWTPVLTTDFTKKTLWLAAMITASYLVIVIAINSDFFAGLSSYAAFQFLGRISFSLYLYHQIVILSAVHGLTNFLPIQLSILLAVPCSLLVAKAGYCWVELPSMRLGNALTDRKIVKVTNTSTKSPCCINSKNVSCLFIDKNGAQ